MADNQVVIDFIGNSESLQASIQEVNKDLINTGKISQAAFTEFNKANQQAEQGTKQLAGNLQELNKVVANGAIKEYSKDLQGAVEKLYDQGKVTEALITKYGTATGALKAMQKELATMATLGQRGTKEFKELAKATAELQDTIQDTRGEIKKMASDTKVFDTLVQGARGLAAGFSLVTGTMAALGSENEDVQKTLLKVQGAMAALQGVQELANIATEKGGIVTQAYGYALTAVEAIEKRFAITTAAAWAVATAGVTLAIGAIIAAIAYFSSEEKEATKSTKELNEELAKQGEEMYKLTSENQKLTGAITDYQKKKNDIERKYKKEAIEAEKKLGGDASEVLKQIEQNKLLELANLHQEYLNSLAEKEADANNKKKKRDESALKEYYANLRERQKADEEYILSQLKAYDEADKKLKEALKEAGDNTELSKEERIQYYFLAGMNKEEIAKRLGEIISEADKQAAEVLNSRIKNTEYTRGYFAKIWEDAKEREKKDQEKLDKEIANTTIKIAQETSDRIFAIEADRRKEALDANLSRLEKQRDIELNRQELTETQKAKITERYLREEAKLKEEAWRADQKAKAEQAIINGLLGATNAIANLAPPYSYIAAALAIATATADASLILSKSVPKFEKGTEYVERGNAPSGTDTIHAMVNEGERIVPTHINKQLAGIKNEDLPKLLQAAYYPPMPHAPEMSNAAIIVQQNIDYNKLGDIIAQKLKDNPQTHLSFDERGFTLNIIEKGKRREIVNSRYGV